MITQAICRTRDGAKIGGDQLSGCKENQQIKIWQFVNWVAQEIKLDSWRNLCRLLKKSKHFAEEIQTVCSRNPSNLPKKHISLRDKRNWKKNWTRSIERGAKKSRFDNLSTRSTFEPQPCHRELIVAMLYHPASTNRICIKSTLSKVKVWKYSKFVKKYWDMAFWQKGQTIT